MTYAGGIRKRALFETETRVADGGGGFDISWSTVTTVWAKLVPTPGRETIEGGNLSTVVMARLRVRSSSETLVITTSDRVTVDSEVYQIRAITNPDQRGRELEMVIERGVGK